MKTILLLALLACLSTARADISPTDGFLEIPWGASPEQQSAILLKRPGVERVPTKNTERHRCFQGGEVAGQQVAYYDFEFFEGRFYRATIVFATNSDSFAGCYQSVGDLIRKKYGAPRGEHSDVQQPYNAGSGPIGLAAALRAGAAKYNLLWMFPDRPAAASATIWLNISRQLDVMLSYTNMALYDRAEKAKELENSKDL